MSAEGTRVEAPCGPVDGVSEDGALCWRGIPYARPPVGRLRWCPPQPLEPWSRPRPATRFGARAVQNMAAAPPGRPPPETTEVSEDCLFLNVCRPAGDHEPLPVIVWIHGGGFMLGSGPDGVGDGAHLAIAAGAVMVTFNYRLGPLGFLFLDELTAGASAGSGNAGLADQLAALRWVRDNITAFGGDPARVTVMGASAGAKSIGTLLGMAAARGLFSQAISMSGGGETLYGRAEATEIAERFLDSSGVATGDLERLQAISVADLLELQTRLGGGVDAIWHWRPVLDGATFAQPPLEAIAAGAASGVRLLIGTNRREAHMFASVDPGCLDGVGDVLRVVHGDSADSVLAAYAQQRPGAARDELLATVMTHERYWIPSVRVAQAQAQHADVWMYRYDWCAPSLGPLGASHGSEQPAVWALPGPDRDAPVPQAIRGAWASFVHGGVPAAPALPAWPRYTEPERLTMLLDDPPAVAADPEGREREMWRSAVISYPRWPRPAPGDDRRAAPS